MNQWSRCVPGAPTARSFLCKRHCSFRKYGLDCYSCNVGISSVGYFGAHPILRKWPSRTEPTPRFWAVDGGTFSTNAILIGEDVDLRPGERYSLTRDSYSMHKVQMRQK
jgi:hypothetical protein